MGSNSIGNQSMIFRNKPVITGAYSVVGKKEGQGPLKKWFDLCLEDDTYGEKTWEKSESKMLKTTIENAVTTSGLEMENVNLIFSGDLLNQIMSSAFMARDLKKPFLGIYGACSTMTEALLLSAAFVEGGFVDNVVAAASSHYCTAERQFRMPLEHGNQRPPWAGWTATAAGAMIVSKISRENSKILVPEKKKVFVSTATVGKIIDTGMKDANQMGAAMAPAAVDTILNHFVDTKRDISYYDMIFTGDLGFIGREIAADLLIDAGINKSLVKERYFDCGALLYDKEQDVHGGGSGCGCSASVYTSYVYKSMQRGHIKKVLLISTGALLSTISPFQGESIPGIAHAVSLEIE